VPPKNDINFLKIFLGKISLLRHHFMRKGKKKRKYLPFFPNHPSPPKNNSLEKKTPYPSQIPLNKTPLFFKFTKTPHLKKTH
jgi:hypothetical protein